MSTIKLYKNVPLVESKNFRVESFASFLRSYLESTITDFQYIKNDLFVSIKINKGQAYLENTSLNNINYIEVFEESKSHYYYVIKKTWRSENTIQYDLKRDVLNQFTWNSDYKPTARTLVTREHKNRIKYGSIRKLKLEWSLVVGYAPVGNEQVKFTYQDVEFRGFIDSVDDDFMYITFDMDYFDGQTFHIFKNEINDSSLLNFYMEFPYTSDNGYYDLTYAEDISPYVRIIDLFSEGINPILYKTSEEEIHDKLDVTWLLHYVNTNTPDPTEYNQVNPVECHLLPKNPVNVFVPTTDGTITGAQIANGKCWWFFRSYYDNDITFDIDGEEYLVNNLVDNFRLKDFRGVAIYNDNGTLKFRYMEIQSSKLDGESQFLVWHGIDNPASIKIVNSPLNVRVKITNGTAENLDPYDIYANYSNADDYTYTWTTGTQTQQFFIGAGEIDRTDAKNIKIIELPYSPTAISLYANTPVIASCWTYDGVGSFELNNENTPFINEFDSDITNPFNNLLISYIEIPTYRNDIFESKLYNSNFYQAKFVYDSFSLSFQFELMNIDSYVDTYGESSSFKVKFVTSRNIVSKFLFVIPQYVLTYSLMDYDNVIPVSRNNEGVLYTSAYINYIRNGYNYDLKTKQRSETSGAIGIGLSAAGTLAGIALGAATSNPLVVAGSVVTGAISLSSQITSYIKGIESSEQTIAQKLQEANNQAVSVRNADDVDLLNVYSNNRAKMCIYEASSRMKEALADLFYYCGYATQEQKIPNINTRYWFNYLQCELDITGVTSNISEDLINELKDKFKNGVTFFHAHNNLWNLDQDKENIEYIIINN